MPSSGRRASAHRLRVASCIAMCRSLHMLLLVHCSASRPLVAVAGADTEAAAQAVCCTHVTRHRLSP